MHQAKNLSSSNKVRCTMLIHPKSAKRLNIEDGEFVLVSSRVGSIKIEVEFSEDMMEDIVSIPHGFGHTKDGTKISWAQKKAGVSVNDITDNKNIDTLTGNAAFSAQVVSITKLSKGKDYAK